MDPLDQLNDQLRQRAHAEEIKQQRQGPPDGDQEQEAKIRALVQQEIASALANFTIQAGQNITVSGTGRNMTIGATVPPQTFTGVGICNDDGTITITITG